MTAITPEDVWDLCSWVSFLFCITLVTLVLCIPRRNAYFQHIHYPGFLKETLEWSVPLVITSFIVDFFLAISAYIVWRDGGWNAHPVALAIFVMHFLLGAFNDCIYYYLYPFFAHFVLSVFICVLVLVNVVLFFLVNTYAGAILLVYLFVLMLGSLLCYKLYALNGTIYAGPTPKCLGSATSYTTSTSTFAHSVGGRRRNAVHVGPVRSSIVDQQQQQQQQQQMDPVSLGRSQGQYEVPPGFDLGAV